MDLIASYSHARGMHRQQVMLVVETPGIETPGEVAGTTWRDIRTTGRDEPLALVGEIIK
jgi:hypothetical protein